MMTDLDLSFFLEPPTPTTAGLLTVDALVPLSMTSAQPGTYYRSQPAPTDAMLYGMLENALGWHFGPSDRKSLLKGLRKQAKKELGRGHPLKDTPWITGDEDDESGSGYVPLLQHHLDVTTRAIPEITTFDDLWARHARSTGTAFPGGSRNYDVRLERVVTMMKQKAIDVGDRAKHDIKDPGELASVSAGANVNVKALRPQYPQYYTSPTPREYVIPQGPYRYRVETTQLVAEMIASALDDPAAPLYLGSNDGWVHASWKPVSS